MINTIQLLLSCIFISIIFLGRGHEYSDEDEEFSSGEEASDSEPTLEDRRRKKNIATGNARVRFYYFYYLECRLFY